MEIMGTEARKQELESLIKRARLSATVDCRGFVTLEEDVEKILEDKA